MKVLIINGHPKPHESYTQRFFYESVATEETVDFVELSEMTLENKNARVDLTTYDRILLQFPIYWYSAPALLKQWIDETFRSTMPYLKHKEFGVIVFFGSAQHKFGSGNAERYTIDEMLKPFEMLANYFEMHYLPPFAVFQFSYLTDIKRKQLLVAYQQHVTGEKQQSFTQKGQWFDERLEAMANTELLREQLKQMLDTYDQLKTIVDEVSDDELDV